MKPLEFDVLLEPTGPNGSWCFIAAPFDVEKTFGTRARVPVRGTINGFEFRSSFSPMDGKHLLCINKTMQAGAGVKPGDIARLVIERDDAPRTVEVPAWITKALRGNREAKAVFDKLSYTHKKEYVDWLVGAKKEETRQRRLEQFVPMLLKKKPVK